MGNEALVDFVNRMIFNVAIANSDMHLKNWSVIYRDGRTPELAPAYDFVSTKLYLGGSETGLAIGSARDFSNVTLEQFERMAQRAQVSSRVVRGAAIAMVERIRDEWTLYRANVPEAVVKVIDDQFLKVPVLAGEHATPIGSDVPSGPTHQEIS